MSEGSTQLIYCTCIVTLLTDHPVVRCIAGPVISRPSYISSLPCFEPELHGVAVYVCVTEITCVKGLFLMFTYRSLSVLCRNRSDRSRGRVHVVTFSAYCRAG